MDLINPIWDANGPRAKLMDDYRDKMMRKLRERRVYGTLERLGLLNQLGNEPKDFPLSFYKNALNSQTVHAFLKQW